MKAQEYEEMLRAGLLTPSGFADAVAMAFGRVLTEAMEEHVDSAVQAGRDPRVRDEVWGLLAPGLGMSRGTLVKTIFGQRYPTLPEVSSLLAHPVLGDRFRARVVDWLANP